MLRWQNFNLACAKYGDLANLTRSPPRAQGLLTSVGPYKIPYKILDICGSLGFQKTLDICGTLGFQKILDICGTISFQKILDIHGTKKLSYF